ncbi:MAG: glycosyltransferase, partial [Pirellulaceae bacterium]
MRLALVTRRYWPLVGGAEVAMANLAHAFQRQGHETRIITAQWDRSWPTEIHHRGIPVIRLPQPRTRGWGTWRYVQALKRYLVTHRHELDAVLISMLKHDAFAAISSRAKHGLPIVLRAEGAGATGDMRWQETGRFGSWIRRATRQADALIAPSRAIVEELVAAGYDSRRIEAVDNGIPLPEMPASGAREAARTSLADWNQSLAAEVDQPVVVYTGRLHAGKGLLELVEAWVRVRERLPRARLWLVGEGELAQQLGQLIRAWDLESSVVMPGVFDDVADLLMAADVFV